VLVLVLVLGGLLAPLGFNALELPVLVSLGLGACPLHDHAFRLSLRSRPLPTSRVSGCAGARGAAVAACFQKRIRYPRRLRLRLFPPVFVAPRARSLFLFVFLLSLPTHSYLLLLTSPPFL
jgi:hypothetical protein